MDWAKALDLNRALSNCHIDILGDWHRDPWGWPELDWVVKRHPELIVERLNAKGVWQSVKIDVAKENFATRPALVLDPLDRLVFQALVDRISPELVADLDAFVFGWRLYARQPQRGMYARNDYQLV